MSGITTADTFETEIYTGVGINDSATNKPITWIKQKEDKVVNGIVVSKSRESIEPLIYPTAKIIGDIGLGNTSRIYVDDADFFEYEKDEDSQINTINFKYLVLEIGSNVLAENLYFLSDYLSRNENVLKLVINIFIVEKRLTYASIFLEDAIKYHGENYENFIFEGKINNLLKKYSELENTYQRFNQYIKEKQKPYSYIRPDLMF